MKHFILALCLLSTSVCFSQNVYLKITGNKSGTIKDDEIPKPKLNDWMKIKSYSFDIATQKDNPGGLILSKKANTSITITKNIGKSSPLLLSALYNNENLAKVTLQIWKTNANGQEEIYETIELTNASLSFFNQSFDYGGINGNDKGPMDIFRLNYQKISITYTNGGITGEYESTNK
ncbi:MAG: type VI secretion system tube protein Hcp [Bacteroidetes bacterium]|nr:type VI secretion system tube protein Hcp [Bacteroidota bacterium]